MTIKVYFNNGENANKPWHVGLHNGRCLVDHFATFKSPIEAINFALYQLGIDLPVIWPETIIIN